MNRDKDQLILENLYKQVSNKKKQKNEKSCCTSCKENKDCECEKKNGVKVESFDDPVPDSIDDAIEQGEEIIYSGDDASSELKEFLPLVFSAAASDLGMSDDSAQLLATKLISKINFNELSSRISDLHQEKEELTDKAKHNMEAQVKLRKVIDKILEEGTYEALDLLFHGSDGVPPSKIVKALKTKLEERISSRK
jgi:hypothetical protein